ncbi:MAG: AAA family ATPase [Thermodesulfobacteriota bacterium]
MLKDKSEYFLNDLGLQLRHPNKHIIALENIFVFPDLKLGNQSVINSKELLKIDEDKNKLSISGIEDSGKTTLIKVLIKQYLNSGYYPVYIDAQNITITDPNQLLELIEKSYEDMYEPNSLERIRIGTNEKKALFIDNFDKVSNNIKVISHILETLCKKFDNLILSEQAYSNMTEDIQLKILYPELAEEIKHYQIIEFSKELQLELIQKWHKLTEAKEPDIESISSKTEKTKKIFDTVIGNNLAPSLPVFLLIILQSSSEEETELVSGSSYGHYYEHLILKSIVNSIGNQNLNHHLEFLSELSYYMFKENRQSVAHEELNYIYEVELKDKGNIESLESITESLIKSGTLIEETLCCFKHKYIYHYFVARYLSANIELESVNEQIKHIISELHNEDYANIVLFLTHLTDDDLIINELLIRTESIFSDEELLLTQEDSLEINELIEELSRLGTKDRKLKEVPTEYGASNIEAIRSHLILERNQYRDGAKDFNLQFNRKSFKAAKNILRITKEFLGHKKNKYK